MKTKRILCQAALMLALSSLSRQLATCFAQGSLTPPGAPAPTFKTLGQIEPGTAITVSDAVTTSSPGSYYLTTNTTGSSGDATTITANNVTLDLNGFTLQQTSELGADLWVPVFETVNDNGVSRFIIVNLPAGKRFYRPIKPSGS
jgi:hypothetical protein